MKLAAKLVLPAVNYVSGISVEGSDWGSTMSARYEDAKRVQSKMPKQVALYAPARGNELQPVRGSYPFVRT